MAIQSTKIEDNTVLYLPLGEAFSPEAGDDIKGFDVLEDRDLLRHPRLRRVLTTLVQPTPLFYGVLHWSDGTDLTELDRKVGSNEATDEDFKGALLAEARTIVCRNCEAQIRALAVDPGRALFASSLAERLQAHALRSSCPACGTPWGVLVVEFLNEDPVP